MKRDKELQKLLLQELRDDAAPPGLAKYTEDEQLHNAALLIQDALVTGNVSRDAGGVIRGVVLTELTSAGHDFLESFEKKNLPTRTQSER